jgi:hypothetical protein
VGSILQGAAVELFFKMRNSIAIHWKRAGNFPRQLRVNWLTKTFAFRIAILIEPLLDGECF